MLGSPTTFWGKLHRPDDASDIVEWHPLVHHCADVAAVAEALLRLPLWRARLVRLAGHACSDEVLDRLGVLAALHDLGKFNLGFQAKGRPDLGPLAGHVEEGLAAIFKPVFRPVCDALAPWGDGVTGMLVAAICHHGRPYDYTNAERVWQRTHWEPRLGLDPCGGVANLLERCKVWFPRAFTSSEALIPDSVPLGHAFAGLVMLADWIGSDERFFPFGHLDEDRMSFARTRARDVLRWLDLDIPSANRTGSCGRDAFSRVAPEGYTPRAAQAEIAGLPLPHAGHGSIAVLESETGSGKTEAAIARFVQLFEAGLVDGLYFALPTRTAALQIHRRVHASVASAFERPPAVVLAVPGYLRVDDVDGRRLPGFEVLWPDSGRCRYRGWAAENTKRYLAGGIVVGTVDQVLLSALMVNHAHLRATSLLRHLLVIDEVHASDAYMVRITREVLGRHLSAGGHALLLSATLGAEARARLIDPQRTGRPSPSLSDAEAVWYPLVTHRRDVVETLPVQRDGPDKVIAVGSKPWLEDHEILAGAALDAAAAGAKVLVIKNTVADCIALQMTLERVADARGVDELPFRCGGVRAPHHSRFARPDRERLDGALEAVYGRSRPDGGCVVVATQTVQQSLDLDSDLLFTDLCPADVLIQRMGRLHRHQRQRPTGFMVARTVVLVPRDRDLGVLLDDWGSARQQHGLGGVYPDLRVLEATWALIERHAEWHLPSMSRTLIERSVHSQALQSITPTRDPRWQAHATTMIATTIGHGRLAELNLVDWSRPYSETTFPESADRRIATRLGEGDRRAGFDTPVTGPFGGPVTELTLRSWWTTGVPPTEDRAESVRAASGVIRFRYGQKSFVYDRLGVRPDNPVTDDSRDDEGP